MLNTVHMISCLVRRKGRRYLWLALPLGLMAACGPREQAADMKLARALDALQQGHLSEAERQLSAIRPGGGWLSAPKWNPALALRLRAQISLKLGARGETKALLEEYIRHYGDMGPAASVRRQMEFLENYRDAGGEPAILYLRGCEAEEDSPTLALREWQRLLRDYPACSLAPATSLRLGLLQRRLGNAAWALAALNDAAELESTALDVEGNPVAPQAMLEMGRVRRDLVEDKRAAREDFQAVIARFPDQVLHGREDGLAWRPADMARYELALMEPAGRLDALRSLAALSSTPTGFLLDGLVGDIRAEAGLRVAEAALRQRQWRKAGETLADIALRFPDSTRGRAAGPRRWYGYEAADWLVSRVGPHAPETALGNLETIAENAKLKEMWAYASLQRVRLLARMGQQERARAIQEKMAERFPNLDCDSQGDGLIFIPAREAMRLLGG